MSGAAARWACPLVAGVDEVGRGPLAGPVTAAAVMLGPGGLVSRVADSKTLSAPRRAALAAEIWACAPACALGWASVAEIECDNIAGASRLAMRRAVAGLALSPAAAWVDGNQAPELAVMQRTLVGGDAREPAIGAASIVAKVARDAEMARLDALYPGYGWARNSGYPTAAHRAALGRLGATPVHRPRFGPVARAASAQIGQDHR